MLFNAGRKVREKELRIEFLFCAKKSFKNFWRPPKANICNPVAAGGEDHVVVGHKDTITDSTGKS
jgi:hypothetical protein